VVFERILDVIPTDRHVAVELRVTPLQLEMLLDDAGEGRVPLLAHDTSWVGDWGKRRILADP
jgi:hypothetical protein